MDDWRIEYKAAFLQALINRKRLERHRYDYIKPEKLNSLIKMKMKKEKLDRLSATNKLINEVREGREL